MDARGLAGTYFVDPDYVDVSGGPTSDQLTVLKMSGWTIGAYSGVNMVSTLGGSRSAGLARLNTLKNVMAAKGFPVQSIAPNQRAWNAYLRGLSVGLFERVRVALNSTPQAYPLPDPLYINNGGTPSLDAGDTPASVNQQVTDFLASTSDLWSIVLHKVADYPPGSSSHNYSTSLSTFTALLDRLKTEITAGNLRVVGYDDL